jgi:guanylate kinase
VTGLIRAGPRGAGKTTLARALVERFPERFAQPVGTTTRAPRQEDGGEYRYVTEAEFRAECDGGGFLVHDGYAGARYGFALRDIEAVRAAGRSPILTLTPAAALARVGAEGWATVWVDAADATLTARLAARATPPCPSEERDRRAADRAAGSGFAHQIDNSGPLDQSIDHVMRVLAPIQD